RPFGVRTVPLVDLPCICHAVMSAVKQSQNSGRSDHQKCRKPCRNQIEQIIHSCCRPAKIQIPVVFVAHHGVHRVDRFIKKAKPCSSDHHIKQRGNNSVGRVLRHRLHRSLHHAFLCQAFRISPHNHGHGLSSVLNRPCIQCLFYFHAFCLQRLCGKQLPAPETLEQEIKHRMNLKGRPQKEAWNECCNS